MQYGLDIAKSPSQASGDCIGTDSELWLQALVKSSGKCRLVVVDALFEPRQYCAALHMTATAERPTQAS
jgi:hypothetical protein